MENNYDPIAKYYDVLSRLVFQRSQVRAQTDQLKFIPAGSRILIVGGGTGWILEDITKLHPAGLHITYVEISARMLELAARRDTGENVLRFLNAKAEDLQPDINYDVIITAFLFDNFSAATVNKVFSILHGMLKPKALWLFSDFHDDPLKGKFWQKWLLETMYFFFRRISSVQADRLTDTEPLFSSHQYAVLQSMKYYSGFIRARVYQKS